MERHGALCEYEKLVIRMNTPRVVIDNAVYSTSTLVKVDSARKHRVLLQAVQVLTDLNLSIKKAYISSDGRYFMDVFHVTDQNGNKLTDSNFMSYIEQSLVAGNCSGRAAGGVCDGLTALELTGTDRPGLLSEVFAVLADLDCDVVEAKVWTHSGRIASLIYVKDGAVAGDAARIAAMEARLRNVLKGDVRTAVAAAAAVVHTERRLHQMMFADRDYERPNLAGAPPAVSVQGWPERGYSVVKVECPDRDYLLFDVVCTLTDMDYVVFHATVDTLGSQAYQEFYIRHADGTPISSEAERIRVIQCLQAAIERRASEGIRLELCTADRQGLLAEVTRTFRENGLSVTRAEVSTSGEVVKNVFYVTDAGGHPVDAKTIEAIRQRVGLSCLKVKETQVVYSEPSTAAREAAGGAGVGLFSIGSLVKRNLYNLGLIKSCS